MNQLQQEAMAYQRAQKVLDALKRNKLYLTEQEYKALRKQAIDAPYGTEMKLTAILKARRG